MLKKNQNMLILAIAHIFNQIRSDNYYLMSKFLDVLNFQKHFFFQFNLYAYIHPIQILIFQTSFYMKLFLILIHKVFFSILLVLIHIKFI